MKDAVPETPRTRGASPLNRRSLVRFGAASAAVAVVAGVELNLNAAFAQRGVGVSGPSVDLGSGDTAVLNYAYALEQLEAEYYSIVLQQPYAGMTAYEQQVIADLRNHEVAHRDFLRTALLFSAIPTLQFDFSRVDFASRRSVLTTARVFEDGGVAAYNGAGQLLQNPLFLASAGSIVSVEGRHVAIIRDLISPLSRSFAGDDVVNGAGLDVARLPSQVIAQNQPFIAQRIDRGTLP